MVRAPPGRPERPNRPARTPDRKEPAIDDRSITGVIAAKAARMGCVAVPFDHPSHDARFVVADAVVPSLADVTSALLERVAGDR